MNKTARVHQATEQIRRALGQAVNSRGEKGLIWLGEALTVEPVAIADFHEAFKPLVEQLLSGVVPTLEDSGEGGTQNGLGDRGLTALNQVPRDVGAAAYGHDCLASSGYEGVQHGN